MVSTEHRPRAARATRKVKNMSEEDQALGYTLWAVLRRDPSKAVGQGDLAPVVASVEASGVTVRGFYDVSGLRADADLMIWLHGSEPEALQSALRELRRAEPLTTLLPTWNAMG